MRYSVLVFILISVVRCDTEQEIFQQRVVAAQKEWSGTILEFGSPQAVSHLSEEGWSHGEEAPDGNTFRWSVTNQASFTITSDVDAIKLSWLECEPFLYDGSPTQIIALSVNGNKITEVELRPGRERYPVELPLVVGKNTIEMNFRYAGDPNRSSPDRRKLAVAFYRFNTLPEGESPIAGLPGPFSWVDKGLYLPAGGSLATFVSLEGSVRLRLSRLASGGLLEVTVRTSEETIVEEMVSGRVDWEKQLDDLGPTEIILRALDESVTVYPKLFVSAKDAPSVKTNGKRKSNIVLVFLDGASALRTGLYGYRKDTTPNLDAIGRDGIVFETAVSQAVYTIASIGSVLTGQYPERHQSISFADKLREDVPVFPQVLSEQGFRTAGFSGNAVVSKTFGLDRGFQDFFQVWEQNDYTGHGDSVLAGFRNWLKTVSEERFFAYVHFREPHFPYNPPEPFNEKFGPTDLFPRGLAEWAQVEELNNQAAMGARPSEEVLEQIQALYDGNLAYVDNLVQQLVAAISNEGLLEDTIFILTADHGEALFEHDYIGHNTQLYEESIRVPLIIKIPGEKPRRLSNVVELIDLAPTILELAGATIPDSMQGTSLLTRLQEKRLAFSRTVWNRPRYSVRDDRYKLIWDSRTGKTSLYDLAKDPLEVENILEQQSFVSGYLEQQLFVWLREQEQLRTEVPPESAEITEEQRKRLNSIGYVDLPANR